MNSEVCVGIIVGSDSDLPIMEQSAVILNELGINFKIDIVSAQEPLKMMDRGKNAHKNGISVIIAGARESCTFTRYGGITTHLPVIGVPIKSSNSIDGGILYFLFYKCLLYR